MMDTFFEEETINYAQVSNSVSKLLNTMAYQFHSQLVNETQKAEYKVTVFDSHSVPDIQLVDYLYRIVTMSRWMQRDVIVALIYADKLINLEVISGISFHNVHRLMAVSLMMSMKFFEDQPYSNKNWTKIVGIPLKELNSLELYFLQALNYDLNVTLEQLHGWAAAISSFTDESPVSETEAESTTSEANCQISTEKEADVPSTPCFH